MEVSKIGNNRNFNARLCGDYRQVIDVAREGGLSGKAVKRLLREVQNILPNNKDRVFFIFRKPYYEDFWKDFRVRSQVEVLRDGDNFNLNGLRANVYPHKGEQKDLLSNFVMTLKRLMQEEIKPEGVRYFYPEIKKPWLDAYRTDTRIKTGFVNYAEGLI